MTPDAAKDWMSASVGDAKDFLHGCNVDGLVLYPVDNRVGNARTNDPDLIKPIDI